MEITLTEFEKKDKEAVKDFIQKAFKEFGYVDSAPDLDDIFSYYFDTGGVFYVLKNETNVIGTIAVINLGEGVAELKKLYVEKSYQRHGFGQQLLTKAISFCVDNNFNLIKVKTDVRMQTAHRLYEKNKFMRTGEDEEFVYMERKLSM